MIDLFRTPDDYELFIYTLTEQFPIVRYSTVTFVRRGASLARVAGEIHFDLGIRLVIRERIVIAPPPVVIDAYGYEGWRGEERLFWYDPQPHRETCFCRRRTPTISTFHQTSNTIVFQQNR